MNKYFSTHTSLSQGPIKQTPCLILTGAPGYHMCTDEKEDTKNEKNGYVFNAISLKRQLGRHATVNRASPPFAPHDEIGLLAQ